MTEPEIFIDDDDVIGSDVEGCVEIDPWIDEGGEG